MDFNDIRLYIGNTGSLIQIIVAIIASIYSYKYKKTFLKYFLVLLWLVVFVDLLAIYCNKRYESSLLVYNLYHLFNFTVLLLIFRNRVEKIKNKKIILFFLFMFLLVYFFNMLFQNYITQTQTAPFVVGGVFVIISVLLYFTEILYSYEILNITRNLLFWISTGLLLYFIVKIPTRVLRNHWEGVVNYENVFIAEHVIGIIMNLFFVIGFIWMKEEKQ